MFSDKIYLSLGDPYFISDALGSVRLTTSSTGGVTFSSNYEPFGINYNVQGNLEALMYTDKQYDTSTGLYYYGARFYNPSIARFMTEDFPAYPTMRQLQEPSALNRYVYVRDNPETLFDPNGHYYFGFWGFLQWMWRYEWWNVILYGITMVAGLLPIFFGVAGWDRVFSAVDAVLSTGMGWGTMFYGFEEIVFGARYNDVWEMANGMFDMIKAIVLDILGSVDWWTYLRLIGAISAQGVMALFSQGVSIILGVGADVVYSLWFWPMMYGQWMSWGRWM